MKSTIGTIKKTLRAFVADDQGRIVVAQTPNAPLIGWFVLLLASFLIAEAPFHDLLAFFSAAFLFTWAYLELTQGVNGFRRTLGAAVIVCLVISRLFWL